MIVKIPASPLATVPSPQTLAAQQEAENALSMALFFLRQDAADIPAASRKAVQGLHALQTLRAEASRMGA